MRKQVELDYSENDFPIVAIQKAGYKGLNFFALEIETKNGTHKCILTADENLAEDKFEYAVQEFKKDVLDYSLREKIKAETEGVRNLILSIAFSKTEFQEAENAKI